MCVCVSTTPCVYVHSQILIGAALYYRSIIITSSNALLIKIHHVLIPRANYQVLTDKTVSFLLQCRL